MLNFSYLKDIDHNSDDYIKGVAVQNCFTGMVKWLRDDIDLVCVNKLMGLAWDIVGSQKVPVSTGPVPAMAVMIVGKDEGKSLATIICPQDWHVRLEKEPYMQAGAVVFSASKAKDYAFGKLEQVNEQVIKECVDRASSYESELLQYFKRQFTDFVPNEYQQYILDKYPEGIKSVLHLHHRL